MSSSQARPIRPVGRTARTTIIGRKIVNNDSCGNQAFPKLSASPTSRLAQNAPWMLPRPPTVTTTKARSTTSKSAPGKTPSKGPPSTPPRAASPAPSANTQANSSGTLIPIPRSISSSSMPARTAAPIFRVLEKQPEQQRKPQTDADQEQPVRGIGNAEK